MPERKKMMIWYSSYNEMIRLYGLYERRFFRDLAVIMRRRFMPYYHTFLECSAETIKLLSSTIPDKDEIQFLINMLNKEKSLAKRNGFCLSDKRAGIKSHLVFPLELFEEQVLGYWIIESKSMKKILGKKQMSQYAKVLSLILQLQRERESASYNLEIDERSGLPGNMAFERYVFTLLAKKIGYALCVFRVDEYRIRLKNEGEDEIKHLTASFIDKAKLAVLGELYSLSEDTIVIVSMQEEKELYAQLYAFATQNDLWQFIKIVMIPSNKIHTENIRKIIEIAMGLCKTGMIWRYGNDGIMPLCMEEGSAGL